MACHKPSGGLAHPAATELGEGSGGSSAATSTDANSASLLSLSPEQFDQLLAGFLASMKEAARLREELQRRRAARG